MPYLVAAVVLLGLLSILNLLLTIGAIRRLRDQPPRPAPQSHGSGPALDLTPGARPDAFTATTTAGEQVSEADVSGLVGFFSAGCAPCHTLAPRFVERARELGRDRVFAVVAGDDAELLAELTPVARVVVEDYDGEVQAAFRNTWTPAVYLLGRDLRVVAAGSRMGDLPSEAHA
ncbi:TlpA disulfide reductase family protein [Streptomyces sp. SID3343]|uniref:TlpA disulfide reductase family protein n=1 Tax=Streptomyces sp. SID3343 TaxID=2690260 RepID=UPI00136A9949|nr:TlpA disulfide reductase family protein [Streptomyces sp. SID3343]MYW05912.1 TlpA family protein disulfide reductase [Streptomyces sp. SID3343]